MAANIFQQGMDAFNQSYDRTEGFRQKRAAVQAGRALASGDRQGAMQAYGDAGRGDAVRTIQDDQMHAEDRQAQQQQAEQARRANTLKQAAVALRNVPPEQRAATYAQSVAPSLKALGIEDSVLQQIPDHLDDASLDTFVGEVDKHLQMVNLGGGGVGSYDNRTGDFKTLREPTQKAPAGFRVNEAGDLEVDPSYVAGRAAIAKATRAPPRPRGAGRAASAAIPTPPSGFVMEK